MLPNVWPVILKKLTLAQIMAVMGWVGAQAVAFGWLTGTKEQIILSAGATILAAAWHAADAWIHSSAMKAAMAYHLAQLERGGAGTVKSAPTTTKR